MGRQSAKRFALVPEYGVGRVQLSDLVIGVDGDQNVGHIRVDLVSMETNSNVLEQSGLVELDQRAIVVHVGVAVDSLEGFEAVLVARVDGLVGELEQRVFGARRRLEGTRVRERQRARALESLQGQACVGGRRNRLDAHLRLLDVGYSAQRVAVIGVWIPDELAIWVRHVGSEVLLFGESLKGSGGCGACLAGLCV